MERLSFAEENVVYEAQDFYTELSEEDTVSLILLPILSVTYENERQQFFSWKFLI